MKERPILFSAPMVRAILDGSKTQTRRVVKPQPSSGDHFGFDDKQRLKIPTWDGVWLLSCPYGEPGDRLWVREAFDFLPTGGPTEPQACEIVYWATGSHELRTAPSDYNPMIYGHAKVRPSIHMPRWASRISLEVTGVRVERLQDISEADSIAEGCTQNHNGYFWAGPHAVSGLKQMATAKQAYRDLWESINGPESWDANSWVWVVEFKRLEGGAA